jgi:ABC-type transport system involved in multi-copper enzyme maturation permease subunit
MNGGGILPVVHRELRAGARRPFNHWLRVAGALGGVAVFCISSQNASVSTVGSQIFVGIHRLVMLLILCFVPAITADCIARERREGTLGLLFLTPLQSWEIVLGKVLVQVLKALTLWLAVIPVLAIPFLMGGVARREVVSQIGAELCAGMFCLAAGIMASSLTDKRGRAFVLAFVFAAVLVFGLTEERGWDVLRWKPSPATPVFWSYSRTVPIRINGTIVAFRAWATRPGPVPAGSGWAMISLWPLAGRLLFSLLVLWGAIRFAGYCVEQSWHDKVPSSRRDNWAKRYCAPIFQQRFARQMQRTLEWNPIAWLQQYSWRARLTKWGFCLGFTVLICMASVTADLQEIIDRGSMVLVILAAAYTYAGVNGFLQEKKSGALELILVTPLTVDQIIFGRVWGLWKQFFPAAMMLALCYHTLNALDSYWRSARYWHFRGPSYNDLRVFAERFGLDQWLDYLLANGALLEFAVIAGFLTLPLYATVSALRARNVVVAAAYTWLTMLMAPLGGMAFGMAAVDASFNARPSAGWLYMGILLGHAVFVFLALFDLHRRLARRDYAL